MTQSVGRRGVALDGRVSHMKVAVFGLGYVGTVTAACLASVDREVVGVDPDLGKAIEEGVRAKADGDGK